MKFQKCVVTVFSVVASFTAASLSAVSSSISRFVKSGRISFRVAADLDKNNQPTQLNVKPIFLRAKRTSHCLFLFLHYSAFFQGDGGFAASCIVAA